MNKDRQSARRLSDWADSPQQRRKGVVWSAAVLLAGTLALGILCMYFSAGEFGMWMFRSYFAIPLLVLLNLLPPVLCALTLWFATGKAGLAMGITAGVNMTITLGGVIKILLRDDPLLVEDLRYLTEATNMAGHYSLPLTAGKWVGVGLCVALTVAVSLLTRRFTLRGKGFRRLRLTGVLVTLGVAILCWRTLYSFEAVYNATSNTSMVNPYSASAVYQSKGGLYPFLYSYKDAANTPPKGYRKATAAAVMAEYDDVDIPADKKVNVVCVMLEAFCDLSEDLDDPGVAQAYDVFHQIQSESISGHLVTNMFAGGTSNTERCFLTGYSLLGNFRAPSHSHVRYFADQGYTVEGSHPGYDWFYNRKNVNENLGFENYYFFENYYRDKEDEATATRDSDAVLFAEIRSLMEQSVAETGKPYFSFSVSYQNHGPYSADSLFFGREYVTDSTGWGSDSRTILNNYLAGVDDTAHQAMAMLDALRESPEPTVVVLFGDHKPWLGDGNSVYTETGINIDTADPEGWFNYYSTPYVIWANDAARETLDNDFVGAGDTVSPCFLMNELFQQCGWTGDAFLQYSDTVRAVTPVLHYSDVFLQNGAYTATLSDEDAAAVAQFKQVQYYWRNNFRQ